jgi:hypothetical protein
MSQVETVALWAGLIASIAGIVLSIVATVFAIWVGKESSQVNQQMIRSLQKIETTVEHLSADTRELITAAWNRLLTAGLGSDLETETSDHELPEELSAGIASEVRSELKENIGASEAERLKRAESALEDLRESVSALLRRTSAKGTNTPDNFLIESVRNLPVDAKALISILARSRHLTRKQYRAATQNQTLKAALKALRGNGLLVPLEGQENGEAVPVYYFPANLTRPIKIASQLAGPIPEETTSKISDALREVGHEPK